MKDLATNLEGQQSTKSSANHVMSKHRLAEISHHFLSDENARIPAWKNTCVLPVLLGSKTDDYIVYELNRAFNRQNRSSMVLNIETKLFTEDSFITGKSVTQEDDSKLPDFCLIPVTSHTTTVALKNNRIILIAHASLSGARIAYNQLSFLASLETDFNVCVVMSGAKNIATAKRFFGFLCDNARSLLSLTLECGGYLLQGQSVDTESEYDVPTDIDGVAKKIVLKPTALHPQMSGRIAPPTGPTAYLS